MCLRILVGMNGELVCVQTGLREFWNRDNMTEADRFLKDYILEKKYIADMSPSDK